MVGMLDDLFISAKVRWSHFVEDFKNDESGLSGVVVAVLLIVISVLAIVGIWGALSGQLQNWWGKVSGGTFDDLTLTGNGAGGEGGGGGR